MLRGILREALAARPDLHCLEDHQLERDPAAVLRARTPSVLILGRPDCDHLRLAPLLDASRSTRIFLVSSEGRSAVLYQSDRLPVTLGGLSPAGLLTLVAAERVPNHRTAAGGLPAG
jgi:hypothetical protein